jgi:triacylglycerol lipase
MISAVTKRLAAILGLAILTVAMPARADTGPALETPIPALDAALHCPGAFTHPEHEPVLLVHGTYTNERENWEWNYAAALPQQGFDVCLVRLPDRANPDIQISTEYVVHAIRRMTAATGRKVDVLGHSQGGLEPRWAVKWWPDVQAAVDDLVMLATPNHGTLIADVMSAAFGGRCTPSCWQMRTTSQFIAALNAGDETPGAVSYTSVYSRTDELVQPATTAPVAGGSNIELADVCPGRLGEHLAIVADAVAHAVVVDALTQPGSASVARINRATCRKLAMPGFDPVAAVLLVQNDPAPPQGFPAVTPSEPPLKPYVTL